MSKAASKRNKFAELRALRQSGKKKFDTYEVDQVADLYEEVDEDSYKKIVRERLNEDDFVVDDNGEGYADDGREDWDRVPVYETESEDELVGRGKGRKCEFDILSAAVLPLTYPIQQRKVATRSKRSGTQMTETYPNTLQRAHPKSKPSPRYASQADAPWTEDLHCDIGDQNRRR
jgi:hypothetical protein